MIGLDLKPYRIDFRPGWDRHFRDFDKEIQRRILAKLEHMKQPLSGRWLHSFRYCVEEVGGCRIAFILDETNRVKHIHFIGNHKQYERWYSGKE